MGSHGAPEEILKQAKPHIGTDKLRLVVRSIREEILRLGGEIRASVTQKTKLLVSADKPGAKLAKAMELGVTIVFAENLRRILKTKPLEE